MEVVWMVLGALLAVPAILTMVGIVSMILGDVQHVRTLRQSELHLTDWPSSTWIYLQAFVSLFTKRSKEHSRALQGLVPIKVTMTKPVGLDQKRLSGYLKLMDIPPSSVNIPIMYPVVECFRLIIQAMLLPAFPFNVMGSVLTKHTSVVYRPIKPDELLTFSVTVSPDGWRTTVKGDTEVDMVSEAISATDQQTVWRATTTAIILNPKRTKGTQDQVPAAEGHHQVIATWRLSSATGRLYGWLNGDLNPIHLHAITARHFGFKRPIAHALYLVGRAEASLKAHGVVLVYPTSIVTEFKRPTLLPATLKCAVVSGGAAGSVQFVITTEDGSKPVLTGILSTAA